MGTSIADVERAAKKVFDLLRNLERKADEIKRATKDLRGEVRRDYKATVRAIREIGEQEVPWMRYSLKTTSERLDDLTLETQRILAIKELPPDAKARASDLLSKLKSAQTKSTGAAKAYDMLLRDFSANSNALYRDFEAMNTLSAATAAGGASAGAIGGAALGSVVPGAGTATGMLGGAAAGALMGAIIGKTLGFINLLNTRSEEGYSFLKATVSLFYPVTVVVEWLKRVFGSNTNLQDYR